MGKVPSSKLDMSKHRRKVSDCCLRHWRASHSFCKEAGPYLYSSFLSCVIFDMHPDRQISPIDRLYRKGIKKSPSGIIRTISSGFFLGGGIANKNALHNSWHILVQTLSPTPQPTTPQKTSWDKICLEQKENHHHATLATPALVSHLLSVTSEERKK